MEYDETIVGKFNKKVSVLTVLLVKCTIMFGKRKVVVINPMLVFGLSEQTFRTKIVIIHNILIKELLSNIK